MVKPTREFRRHHDVEAPEVDEHSFRQGWIVRTRLDQLLADFRITPGEWQAAVEFRVAWERVIRANSTPVLGMRVSGGAGSNLADDRLAAVADTVTLLRVVEATIGGTAFALCFRCAVEDRTWAETGRHYQRDPHTVRAWTVEALHGLAPSWAAFAPSSARKPLHGLPRAGKRVVP